MKRKQKYNQGDLVKSKYRARWVGRIIDVQCWATYKNRQYPIYRVIPILDSKGRKQPKSVKVQTLSQAWLEPYKKNET